MIKVLHIIENFGGQAIEKWLYQLLYSLRTSGTNNIDFTFYSILGYEGNKDSMVRDLGATIIYAPCPMRRKLTFYRALRKAMLAGGYDILHCHHDILSAVYLTASAGLPMKKRIVHVHNTSPSLPTPNRLKVTMLHEPMRQICLHYADHIVGISRDALNTFLKNKTWKPNRDMVLHCGIDTASYHKKADPVAFRETIGLPPDTKILLFVGRMIEYKNPSFLIDVLEYLQKSKFNISAVFAGAGPLETVIQTIAKRRLLSERVRVLGWRDDIPHIMQCSDLLVWPVLEQPKEGLGLGIVEAQAAGLPVIMSRSVPEEAIVIPELVTVLPLFSGPQTWADKIVRILKQSRPSSQKCLHMIESSPFAICKSALNIMKLYSEN